MDLLLIKLLRTAAVQGTRLCLLFPQSEEEVGRMTEDPVIGLLYKIIQQLVSGYLSKHRISENRLERQSK